MATEKQVCCPEGYPEDWHEKEIHWQDKLFVKGRVRSILHIPLNFGSVLKKNVRLIESAGAMSEEMLVVSDENSLWGADIYISVTKEVPHAQTARLSGIFLTKVFEGPYKQIPTWIREMTSYVRSKGKEVKRLYLLYRTCPKCAKKYGKNYVVLLAQV
ncbi:MAG: hypothetical protein NTY19_13535 [Planctomycetota bacterium]|nr:hypothetical protein [Planctomycetota bacterium]